jgi:hypothetical protein
MEIKIPYDKEADGRSEPYALELSYILTSRESSWRPGAL